MSIDTDNLPPATAIVAAQDALQECASALRSGDEPGGLLARVEAALAALSAPAEPSDDLARADALARSVMALRPDLAPLSLDEWIQEHREALSPEELRAASACLLVHPDYRGAA